MRRSHAINKYFEAKHFHDAVFDAFKALENAIREKIGAPMDEVGMSLSAQCVGRMSEGEVCLLF